MEPFLYIAFLDRDAGAGLAESITKAWPQEDGPNVLGLQVITTIMPDSSRLRIMAMWTAAEHYGQFCEKVVQVAPLTKKGAALKVPHTSAHTNVLVVYGPEVDTGNLLSERPQVDLSISQLLWEIGGLSYRVWALPFGVDNEALVRRLAQDIGRMRSYAHQHGNPAQPNTAFLNLGKPAAT